MNVKQELRIYGVVLMTGAAVGVIGMTDLLGMKVFGILGLYVAGVLVTSTKVQQYVIRKEQEREKKIAGETK